LRPDSPRPAATNRNVTKMGASGREIRQRKTVHSQHGGEEIDDGARLETLERVGGRQGGRVRPLKRNRIESGNGIKNRRCPPGRSTQR